MIELASFSPTVQALFVVGLVVIEAVVLYTGYGVVERIAGPPLIETVENA